MLHYRVVMLLCFVDRRNKYCHYHGHHHCHLHFHGGTSSGLQSQELRLHLAENTYRRSTAWDHCKCTGSVKARRCTHYLCGPTLHGNRPQSKNSCWRAAFVQNQNRLRRPARPRSNWSCSWVLLPEHNSWWRQKCLNFALLCCLPNKVSPFAACPCDQPHLLNQAPPRPQQLIIGRLLSIGYCHACQLAWYVNGWNNLLGSMSECINICLRIFTLARGRVAGITSGLGGQKVIKSMKMLE